nr:glutamine amidotransferase [Gordonia jinghuaiqii]
MVLPDVMGTYGDGGNALVLKRRALMRGIDAEVVHITLDDPVPASLDAYTLGGAEDYAQRLATRHLTRYPGLQQAAAAGRPVLAICAAIQVLGHWYETSAGERVEGISMFDVTTSPQEKRSIGELLVEPAVPGLTQTLTGFENHRGATRLGTDAAPLGRVRHGVGNGVGDGTEGVVQGSVIGTYMHGPALARNPELADHILATALGVESLAPLVLPEVERLRKERLAAGRRR